MDLIPYYLGSHYNVSVNLIRSEKNGRVAVTSRGSNLLPNDGSYYVEITQGKRKIQGKYHLYPGMEHAEITSHFINRLDQHCSLKFLSKIESIFNSIGIN
ncbi:riboflavin kinase / FMN adenylyltransferase [Natribacillus halophilus]|uniref:Riboflavin kinase / FMN adenylyltransferase n=1 Tax=Natribacillus halophilus TaxID=549003 RepID=A0A1G8MWD7_9BACI|nr:riboflavin kinase / FMN adenylyltransferase [Natribacillus halophilus]